MIATVGTTGLAQSRTPGSSGSEVIELRQYKLVAGKRGAFLDLFEKNFVESQEAAGITLVGLFTDDTDPDRFTWVRKFPDMAARRKSLEAFYFGPVWQANRGVANPMLDDNDNVLLLKPAAAGTAFEAQKPATPDAPSGRDPVVLVTIQYLWKEPSEGYTAFFQQRVAPALKAGGLPVIAAYVREEQPNDFVRLPVRQKEKVFVWFTRAPSRDAANTALRALQATPAWRDHVAPALTQFEERPAQRLVLHPTKRSALR